MPQNGRNPMNFKRLLWLLTVCVACLLVARYVFDGALLIRMRWTDDRLRRLTIRRNFASKQIIHSLNVSRIDTQSNERSGSETTGIEDNLLGFAARGELGTSTQNIANTSSESTLPLCPEVPEGLGPIPIYQVVHTDAWFLEKYPWLHRGGRWRPSACRPRFKVAVVIPFRWRRRNLRILLRHLHPMLMSQRLDYVIYVIEQYGSDIFNKGVLYNAGFLEVLRHEDFDCFVFHDADLVPTNARNMYSCPEMPRHHVSKMYNEAYYFYRNLVGGVLTMTTEHFRLVNGYSNNFWGWGGEDDDLYNRIITRKLYVGRYTQIVGRYFALGHKKRDSNDHRYAILLYSKKFMDKEGLNSVRYTVKDRREEPLYTWILIDVRPQL